MAIDSADVDSSGNIYAGRINKIYKSTDGGSSFSTVYTVPGSPTQIRRVFVASNGYVYVSGYDPSSDNGLYRSIDGGSNWTKVIALDANCSVWAIEEGADGDLFAGEYSVGAGQAQIWKSTDDGANWTVKYSNNAGAQDHIHSIRYDASTGYIYATYGDVGANIIIRSLDAGENWSTIATGALRLLAIAFLGGWVYVGTDSSSGNKIYKFQDAGGASVTLSDALVLPAGKDSQVFDACETASKVFFGTWTPSTAGTVSADIVVFDGSNWTYPHSIPYPIGYEGYWNISRHNRNGVFYVSNGNEKGVKFTP